MRAGELLELAHHRGPLGPGIDKVSDGLRAARLGYLVHHAAGRPFVAPVVAVSADRVEAALDLRAPAGDEALLTREEVEEALAKAKVTAGLSSNRVDAAWRIFTVRGELLRPMWVARGKVPVPGRPSRIDWAMDLEARAVGEEDEHGRVDFHDRSSVRNLTAGDLIGHWIPGGVSEPGRGVDGSEVPVPESGKPKPLRVGRNVVTTELDEGWFELRAEVDGILVLEDGVPSVSKVLKIAGDVDFGTGNIEAEGSVVVAGAVRRGFTVRARDDVTVLGVVEGGSVHAGGQVNLEKGLIGDEEALVTSGGDARIRYAQNARVECRGDLELVDADMGSSLVCSGRLLATTGRGRLRGGTYSAGRGIRAQELGSELGAVTRVEAGIDHLLERERGEITVALDFCRSKLREAQARKGTRGRQSGRRPDIKLLRELAVEEKCLVERLAGLPDAPPAEPPPFVLATQSVHFGVEVQLGGVLLRPAETTGGRRFTYDPANHSIETTKP